MGGDEKGFITESVFRSFQPASAPVVSDVVQKLSSAMPDLIHRIYVYGRMPEGTGRVTLSDLDIMMIFTRKLDDVITDKIHAIKTEL